MAQKRVNIKSQYNKYLIYIWQVFFQSELIFFNVIHEAVNIFGKFNILFINQDLIK